MKNWNGYKKGVNLGGWLSQCCHEKQHYETFIQEKDIATIASWGVDHVRLPFDYVVVQDEKGSFLPEGFVYIDRCIQWCETYGLNLVLDLHKTKGFTFDEEVYSFFEQEELQDMFYALWEKLASLYGKYKDKVSFELLNEITDIKYAKLWNDIAKNTISKIRQFAPETYILVGGVWNNSIDALEMLDAPYDDKIIYNFHCYSPLLFTHQQAYWIKTMSSEFTIDYPASTKEYIAGAKDNLNPDLVTGLEQYGQPMIDQQYLENLFSVATRISEERDVPIYCGEYGVIDKVDAKRAVRWYQDMHSIFEKYNIGRSIWTYKEMDFGIVDESRSEILPELIQLL